MRWSGPAFAFLAVPLFFGAVEGILWAVGVSTLAAERDPFQGFYGRIRVFRLDEERGAYGTPRPALASFNYQEFRARKPEDGFRFFILGGSSAYGFPWGAEEAFTRYLGDALRASWPGRTVEAINAGAMSYASHRLRILSRELLDYEPDALVIYSGHNEFVERRFYEELLDRPRALDPVRRLLHHSRLYSLMTRSYLRDRGDSASPASDSGPGGEGREAAFGIRVARDPALNVTDAEREEMRRLFEENLRAILDLAGEAGVAVVLCTVPSNVSGWVPNQSVFPNDLSLDVRKAVGDLLADARAALGRGDAASAAAQLERARQLSPGYAELHFYLGQAYEALGRWEEARASYVRARDSDASPQRAISSVNDTIRRLAEERDVPLVDVEDLFEREAPHGLLGFDWFEDYVHPKPEAHRQIALALWTLFEEEGLLGEARAADEASFWKALEAASGPRVAADTPEARNRTAMQLYNTGVVLMNQGLLDEAEEKFRACRELNPLYTAAGTNLGYLLYVQGRLEESAAEFREVLQITPRHVPSLIGLGESLRRMGRLERAGAVLGRATRIDAGSARAWSHLGMVLYDRKHYAEAEAAFRKAAKFGPEDADARSRLGMSLIAQERFDEALPVFRESLELQPHHVQARNGLALVFAAKGEFDRAERLFREVLRASPNNEQARRGVARMREMRARPEPR
jgi:Flp pilus assembly protein TadD